MKKRDYEKPSMKVVELKHQVHLLQASGTQTLSKPNDYEQMEDPFEF